MHIESDRALVPSGTPAARYLTITIAAPESHRERTRPAVAVALVLDRSGSMAERKIEYAREAVAQAIRLLDGRDTLAVVVYDDRVDVVLERCAASKEAKALALSRLETIDARGSTDLAAGWFTGAAQLGASTEDGNTHEATRPQAAGVIHRTLLLTDGLANRGIVERGALARAAARFREQGVSTSTFGLGADFDEELLTAIATEGGGHFYFLEHPKQIPDLLASELGETLDVVARDAIVELMPGPGVEAMLLSGLPADHADGRVRVRLGDLASGQQVTLVFAMTIAAQLPGSRPHVDCRLSDRDHALFAEPMRVDWLAAPVEDNERQPVNHAVLIEVARTLALRARATAVECNRRGAFDEARRVLRDIAEQIRQLRRGDESLEQIAAALAAEAAEFSEPMSAMLLKRRHYAAYSAAQSREADGKARRRQPS